MCACISLPSLPTSLNMVDRHSTRESESSISESYCSRKDSLPGTSSTEILRVFTENDAAARKRRGMEQIEW